MASESNLLSTVETNIQSATGLVIRYLQTLWLAIFRPKRFRRAIRADRNYRILVRSELFIVITIVLSNAVIASMSVVLNENDRGVPLRTSLVKHLEDFSLRPPNWEQLLTVGLPVLATILVLGRVLPLLVTPAHPSQHRSIAKSYYYSAGVATFIFWPTLLCLALALPALDADYSFGSDLLLSVDFVAVAAIALIYIPWRTAAAVLGASPRSIVLRWRKLRIAAVAWCGIGTMILPILWTDFTEGSAEHSETGRLKISGLAYNDSEVIHVDWKAKTATFFAMIRNTGDDPCYLKSKSPLLVSRWPDATELEKSHEANRVLSAVDSLNATEAEKARIDLGHIILPCRLDTTDSVHPPAWEIKPGSVVIVRITADLGSNGIVARHRPRSDEASFQQGIVSWLIGEKLPGQEIILRVAYERFKDGEFETNVGSISFGRQI